LRPAALESRQVLKLELAKESLIVDQQAAIAHTEEYLQHKTVATSRNVADCGEHDCPSEPLEELRGGREPEVVRCGDPSGLGLSCAEIDFRGFRHPIIQSIPNEAVEKPRITHLSRPRQQATILPTLGKDVRFRTIVAPISSYRERSSRGGFSTALTVPITGRALSRSGDRRVRCRSTRPGR